MAAAEDGFTGLIGRIRDGVGRRWQRMTRSVQVKAGVHNRWRDIDPHRIRRLVFVCSGNICRSPYAEQLWTARGLMAVSCGLSARGGASADPQAIDVALARGVDLSGHVSRNISELSFGEDDLLVLMDLGHLRLARSIGKQASAQVTLLALWDTNGDVEVKDPFGMPRESFETCFDQIERCVDSLLEAVDSTVSPTETEKSSRSGSTTGRL